VTFSRTMASLILALTVLAGAACARKDWIDQTLVTVDVTGIWEGQRSQHHGPGGGGLELTPEQKGAKVVGTSRGAVADRPTTSGPSRGRYVATP